MSYFIYTDLQYLVVVVVLPSRDGVVEELHGDSTVGPRPKVWTRSQK